MSPEFIQGGGEMGALIRAHDWTTTGLGPPETWAHPLRTTVRLLLNTVHPMYIWWGPDLLCFYNDSYRQLIGRERHPGSLGRPAREVWEEIWPIIGPQIALVMAGGGATWQKNALIPITRDGRLEDVYWTYSYSPINDESAAAGVGGVLVICSETTEQVEAARRIAEERERLTELFEQTPNFRALLRGPEHRIELVNPGFVRLLGQQEVVGRTVAEALPFPAAERQVELLTKVLGSGETLAANGVKFQERYIDFVYQPIKDGAGAVTGILVEGTDVTGRVLTEAELRESEARFLEVADAAPVLIWISDVTKKCIWFNKPWLEFTGRSIEQDMGVGWVDGVHPEDIDACVEVYNDAFERHESYRTEYRRRRHDGEWRVLDSTGVPRFAGGAFVGFIGSCIDVTDQRAATRALSESEEQLRLATGRSIGRRGSRPCSAYLRMFPFPWPTTTADFIRTIERPRSQPTPQRETPVVVRCTTSNIAPLERRTASSAGWRPRDGPCSKAIAACASSAPPSISPAARLRRRGFAD